MNNEYSKKPLFTRLSTREKISFAKRLGMLLHAGTPILESLRMMRDGSRGMFSYVLDMIAVSVARGSQLSSAMEESKVFDDIAINMVHIGESSGTLPENLIRLAEELKRRDALRGAILGAMTYPAVIVIASAGIIGILVAYIFPKITPVFQSMRQELPISTRIIMWVSHTLQNDWLWIIMAAAAMAAAAILALRSERIHLVADRLLLSTPLLGIFSRHYNLANCARTLALLLEAGTHIVPAVHITADCSRNKSYREVLHGIADSLAHGEDLSTLLRAYPSLFPPLFCQMIAVGERTSAMPETFAYLANIYEEDLEDLTKRFTTLLEPILMIATGGIVGFIAISIITPIYGITQQLSSYH